MKLHPASLLVGAALMVGVGLLSAQNLVNAPNLEVTITDPVTTYDLAPPRDFVVIRYGTAYTVPAGRVLVVTSLGTTTASESVEVKVDGLTEAREFGGMGELATPGLACQPGSVVEVDLSTFGRAWGYLADL